MRILGGDGTKLVDGAVIFQLKKLAFEDKVRLVAMHLSDTSDGMTICEFKTVDDGKKALRKMALANELVDLEEELKCLIQ